MEEVSEKYIPLREGRVDLSRPMIMGILNVTPDSFYEGSRKQEEKEIVARIHQIVEEGGDLIDIGAYSSRPDAADVSPEEEMDRLRKGLRLIRSECPRAVVSVDTFRADVARMCVEEYGADIINDISAGDMDADMLPTVAALKVPYIMMHMQGIPQTMQDHPHYTDIVKEIIGYFTVKISQARALGMESLIVDPGFGFGKTLEHNYELMNRMEEFGQFHLPVLVGISRKSMIYKLLGGSPKEALNGTTVLNTVSLMKGADILRVHDVKAASEVVRIYNALCGK